MEEKIENGKEFIVDESNNERKVRKLIELVDASDIKFFRSDTGELCASVMVGVHREIFPVKSEKFRNWLGGFYYYNTNSFLADSIKKQVVSNLSDREMFASKSETVKLSTRIADTDGAIWYDLTNNERQAILITTDGWDICDEPPLVFDHFVHQAPQVTPIRGGDVNKILKYINIKEYKVLFLCWLVSCFVPNIPHVIPVIFGEKGAAKSTACAFLKKIIDPSAMETLSLPSDEKSRNIIFRQHWFAAFDNVSEISKKMSDALCRAVTGNGTQVRKLFTDSDDVVFNFQRCIAINGVNNVATRSDLLDRSILFELQRVPDAERRERVEMQKEFEADRPAILGGIFDILAKALEAYPSLKPSKLLRMADFTRWGYVIGEALGGMGDVFIQEYDKNYQIQNIESLNADTVGTLTVEFMRTHHDWEGSPSKFLDELKKIAPEYSISKGLPSTPNHLTRSLNEIKSNLESVGIEYINFGHGRNGTTIMLTNHN